MKQPMVVINKSGGAGGEGFLDVKTSSGNPHKIIITLSNLFTTPLATGIPFSWKDLTPVAMLALDEFVLWVNAEKPYKSAKDFIDAAKAAPAGTLKIGGTGSKQEDQIITAAIEKAIGARFTYIPYKGGGEVAVQLVGNHIDSSVNNPIEAVAQWRGDKLRPLCVFDGKTMEYDEKIAGGMSWKDIPTCKSQGLDMKYLMLSGVFMSPKATKDQVDYYIDLFKKVRATPDWQEFMKSGAFNTTFLDCRSGTASLRGLRGARIRYLRRYRYHRQPEGRNQLGRRRTARRIRSVLRRDLHCRGQRHQFLECRA
jgi:putative tricarboxylic transport membrane protein